MKVNPRLRVLAELIETDAIRGGVLKLLDKYHDALEWMPTSSSGTWHVHEPLLISHIENCMNFARLVAREFNMDRTTKSIFYAGIILHDIGKCKTTFTYSAKGTKKGKYHKAFKRHFYINREHNHALWGGMILRSADFMFCEVIAGLVERHMGHWKRRNPQPKNYLQQMVAFCDYLATHVESYKLSEQGGEVVGFVDKRLIQK